MGRHAACYHDAPRKGFACRLQWGGRQGRRSHLLAMGVAVKVVLALLITLLLCLCLRGGLQQPAGSHRSRQAPLLTTSTVQQQQGSAALWGLSRARDSRPPLQAAGRPTSMQHSSSTPSAHPARSLPPRHPLNGANGLVPHSAQHLLDQPLLDHLVLHAPPLPVALDAAVPKHQLW